MGGLFGGGQSVSTSSPVISSMQLQTSAYGRPLTWVFGRARIAPNLIQYDDFTAIPHTTQQRTGKGGSSSTSTSYSYTAAIVMAISSGPVQSVERIWRDKEVFSAGDINLDVYLGDAAQEAYPYFVTKHPDKALTYRGISYIAAGAYALDDSAGLGNHTLEVQACGSIKDHYAAGADVLDCEIADVITALATDPDQGVGIDLDGIGDLSAFRSFCLANQLWVSPAYTEQQEAFAYIKNLLTIGFADCVYSGGIFKVVPYSDVPATSSLATYTPDRTIVCDLTEDDFIGDADADPIVVRQKSSKDCFNHVRVKFADRSNDYNDNIAEATDPSDIQMFGRRSMDVIDLPEIKDAAVAQKVADFLLHRSLYILNTYEFRLPWKHVRLEPMDIVTLNYERKYLDATPVLITQIDEDEDGLLSIIAEDYPIGTNHPTGKLAAVIGNDQPNYSVAPGDVMVPAVIEPPGALTDSSPEVWLATAGGPDWGGCVVWASTDNISYQSIGTLRGPSRYGVLAAPLAGGTAVDEINTLAVDLTVSGGELSGGTHANADDLLTVSYVDGEYVAYADVALTAANAYALSYLVRGAYGSAIAAHPQGGQFIRLDDGLFRYRYPREWIGRTIWFKLVSFNKLGNGMQDLSKVVAYQHVIAGAQVVQSTYLRTRAQVFSIYVEWDLPAGAADYLQCTELWYATTADRASASKLGAYASPQDSHTLTGLPAGAVFYFWVRIIDKAGNIGAFYPSGEGVRGETSSDAKVILDWVAGQIGKTQLAADLLKPIELIGGIEDLKDSLAAVQLSALITANNAVVKEAAARQAAITIEQTTRQDELESVAVRIDTVQAAISATEAVVQTETVARANADGALASRIDTVQAATSAVAAAVQTETTARANEDGALASRIDTVQAATSAAAVAVQTTSSTLADLNDNLAALYTIKTAVTAGGRTVMAGIGVGVDNASGVLESQILLSAQRVAVIDELGGAVTTPFVVQGGQVFINQAFIAEASISSAKIRDASIDSAKIGDAQVTTLKIGANSVTIPAFLSGYGSAGVSSGEEFELAYQNVYYAEDATLAIIVNWQSATTGNCNSGVNVYVDGVLALSWSDSVVGGYTDSHSASGRVVVAKGLRRISMNLSNSWSGGAWSINNWSLLLLGIMR